MHETKRKHKDLFYTFYQEVISRHLPQSMAPVHLVIAVEDRCHNNECSSSFSFLLVFIAEQMSYGMEYLSGHIGSSVLAVFPPKMLPTPQPTCEGGIQGIQL